MAGYGNQGYGIPILLCLAPLFYDGHGTAESPRHILDKSSLATARGALQEDGQLLMVGRLKQLYLVCQGTIVRLVLDNVLLYGVLVIKRAGSGSHA